ncbi:DUF6702 family protein [Algibacter miyuki]|uniref:DUF6702 family protein n=1 Tax=Algibacter miyuki TaxID=1306933 RepID=A0ABV5H1C4_9FLAO|nr:DUF6702 family protein [Algibacter miyuki]MDN3666309.1 peptidase E [Algibacter miyuki]
MNRLKIFFLLTAITFFSFTTVHKYYISVTQVEFVKEKQSVQIISRLFIDDFETVLRNSYGENITLAGKNEPDSVNEYMFKYLKDNVLVSINKKKVYFKFIGKEYDGDIVRCYLEIENISDIKAFEISNKLLFDVFNEQQNIVKTKINSKQKSVILTEENNTALLYFD